MNIRNRFEQAVAALMYGMALAIVGYGTLAMCAPATRMIA
jgi:hypothetical protein